MPFCASSWVVGGQQWSCNLLILLCWNTHDVMSLPWISSPFAACSVTQFGVPSLKKMESFIGSSHLLSTKHQFMSSSHTSEQFHASCRSSLISCKETFQVSKLMANTCSSSSMTPPAAKIHQVAVSLLWVHQLWCSMAHHLHCGHCPCSYHNHLQICSLSYSVRTPPSHLLCPKKTSKWRIQGSSYPCIISNSS